MIRVTSFATAASRRYFWVGNLGICKAVLIINGNDRQAVAMAQVTAERLQNR
jgi:hypothetical protein